DAVSVATVGGRGNLCPQMYRAIVRATVVGGEMHVAVDATGDVVGTAAWFPPGSDLFSSEEQNAQGFTEFFELIQKVDPDLHSWWFSTLLPEHAAICAKYLGTEEDPEGKNFKMNNWNLFSFSVVPELRRRGIGTRLLKIGEDKASLTHISKCMESDS
ncbi:hypothetical protein BD410DRAFT_732815, partial [Rickenella mellea]